jgi:hypothetical protein
MTIKTPIAILLICLPALAVGCNAEVTGPVEDEDEIELGGGGSSAGGGQPTDDCPDPPLDCIGGTFQEDAGGCTICVYDEMPTGCELCSADQACITCNSAGPPAHYCENIVEPAEDQFACKWTSCSLGEICLDEQPPGDGCPDASCGAVPEECADNPTCDCLIDAFGAFDCSVDEAGNITVKGWYFP